MVASVNGKPHARLGLNACMYGGLATQMTCLLAMDIAFAVKGHTNMRTQSATTRISPSSLPHALSSAELWEWEVATRKIISEWHAHWMHMECSCTLVQLEAALACEHLLWKSKTIILLVS